jgi:hypothetical protein
MDTARPMGVVVLEDSRVIDGGGVLHQKGGRAS